MIVPRLERIPAIIIVTIAATCFATEPAGRFVSPDKHYLITLAKGKHNEFEQDETIIEVRTANRILASHPTEGPLLEAFWSGSGKYVAIENRIANSGDYVWVFGLRDGRTIKAPDDDKPDHPCDYCFRAVWHRVAAKFSKYEGAGFYKSSTHVKRWLRSDELELETIIGFTNPNGMFRVTDAYRVSDAGFVLIRTNVREFE